MRKSLLTLDKWILSALIETSIGLGSQLSERTFDNSGTGFSALSVNSWAFELSKSE